MRLARTTFCLQLVHLASMGDQHVISMTNQSHGAVRHDVCSDIINGCIELERETPRQYKGYGRIEYLLSIIHHSHGSQ